MKFWQVVSFTEPDQLVEVARAAEEAGFHGILLSDHLVYPARLESTYPYSADGTPGFDGSAPFPEPWVAIAAMAAVTEHLRFSTLVYVLPLRHPLEVAKAVGTAAVLSRDRVALGAGAGWLEEEYAAVGVDFHTRGRRYDEMIEVLRKIWQGGRVEHHGRFFDFAPLEMNPVPGRPVPIYVGGLSRPALRRAARLGDGWLGTGQDPDQAARLLADLRALRREAGRESEPFETIVPLSVPPDADTLLRLEEQHGMTATTAWPFLYTLGPGSGLAAKRDSLRRFGDEVIAKFA